MLLCGSPENYSGKALYTSLPTATKKKETVKPKVRFYACGSCQGMNLGLPVSC